MSYVIGVFQTVLPVLFVIGIGVYSRHKNMFSREGINTLKSAAVNIALPAVLLRAFATAKYSPKTILAPIMIFLVCSLGLILGKCICRLFHIDDRYLPYMTTCFEVGMLGYTFFGMLYDESVATFALFDLGQVLFTFTIFRILLERENPAGPKSSILKELATSPIILAITAGVIIGASGFYHYMETIGINGIFDTTVSFVAAPTSVLILISIGYDLILKGLHWSKVIRAVFARALIMLPAAFLTYFLLKNVFTDTTVLKHAVMVLYILPPPYALPIFAGDKSQAAYLSSSLTVFTLISIVGFAVLACIS